MEQTKPDHRMIGALLRVPFQAINTRIAEGLVAVGYTDLRPAHFAVFQHIWGSSAHRVGRAGPNGQAIDGLSCRLPREAGIRRAEA